MKLAREDFEALLAQASLSFEMPVEAILYSGTVAASDVRCAITAVAYFAWMGTLKQMGKLFGHADHTTCVHYKRKHLATLINESAYSTRYAELENWAGTFTPRGQDEARTATVC